MYVRQFEVAVNMPYMHVDGCWKTIYICHPHVWWPRSPGRSRSRNGCGSNKQFKLEFRYMYIIARPKKPSLFIHGFVGDAAAFSEGFIMGRRKRLR